MATDDANLTPAPTGAPASAQPNIPDTVVQAAVQQEVRQIAHTFGVQFGPAPHPLANQLSAEHITQSLTNADNQDGRKHLTQRIGMAIGVVGFIGLCWLFLDFGKADSLDKVIALFIGLAGGYGLGKVSR